MTRGGSAHTHALRQIIASRNIVGVGISEKVTKKQPTGNLAMTFYVQKKVSPRKLRANMAVPPTVPESISGPEAISVRRDRPREDQAGSPRPGTRCQPGYSVGHAATARRDGRGGRQQGQRSTCSATATSWP